MPKALLSTEALTVGYARGRRAAVTIAERLHLHVNEGEIVCLLGANGVGKSTLLRTLAVMQPPLSGLVSLGGANAHRLPAREIARRLALVLTDRVSAGALSAYALVALGRHAHTDWAGRLRAADHDAVRRALTAVGAQHLAARMVDELSDGERQKVMIARALAQETPLLILDEVTAFLDLPRRIEIMALLHDLAHRGGKAVLVSTHDLELALRTADVIWLLSSGGRVDVGAPEDLIMSGALARAFAGAGVEFDPQTGHFHAARRRGHRVRLEGDGLVARWTAHALERYGFDVHVGGEVPALPRVCVIQDGTGRRWTTEIDGRRGEHASVTDLTRSLRLHFASAARSAGGWIGEEGLDVAPGDGDGDGLSDIAERTS